MRRAHVPAESEPTPAQQARCLAIARLVWFGFVERADVAAKLIQVDEVLAGLPVPTLSQVDREAILAAAARIPEEP
jgi:hypothetical protein